MNVSAKAAPALNLAEPKVTNSGRQSGLPRTDCRWLRCGDKRRRWRLDVLDCSLSPCAAPDAARAWRTCTIDGTAQSMAETAATNAVNFGTPGWNSEETRFAQQS